MSQLSHVHHLQGKPGDHFAASIGTASAGTILFAEIRCVLAGGDPDSRPPIGCKENRRSSRTAYIADRAFVSAGIPVPGNSVHDLGGNMLRIEIVRGTAA